ncbi:DUF2457 domain-containing protein [Amycolatopsis sp. K13G38]|uniref:DUF2457 domain-containing protein n=1 Tax=Amycolatopsis acididurans TaxID=2724524 RepID=A0ABX1JCF7_9PSEU|nr:DUF2457 domain-containing protein [Amycolatopsis acididurans]NKQ56065.1 DUF2457 domain-containing protein [Amycolatopsis acididurans]
MTYDHNQRRPGDAGQGQRGRYQPPPPARAGMRPPPPARAGMRPPPPARAGMRPSPPARPAERAPQNRGTSRQLGRVDPFCWIAAGPLFIVGVGLAVIAGNVWIGVVGVAFSAALVLFDARVNRTPVPPAPRSTSQAPARRPPQRRQ